MKKFTLIAFALMASATSFAQTVLWDGENAEITSKANAGFWPDGSPTLAENPEKDGINTSEHCIKFTMTNDSKVVKLAFREWIRPSMNGSKRVSLMIKKSASDNVMIELSAPTDNYPNDVEESKKYWKKQAAWCGGDDKWQKLVFDFSTNGDFDNPGVIAITAQTGKVDGEQTVYIDNIVIEDAPRIDGKLFSEYGNTKITGNVKLTGAWMKGISINADGDWTENEYNDFNYFNEHCDEKLTSVDMRGTVTKDVDVDRMFDNRPNALLYADEAYVHANVVAEQNFKNASEEEVHGLYAANGVVLNDAYAFSCPEAFTAANVKLTRTVREGVNSFVLPFYTGASDLESDALATYKETADGNAVFTKADHAEANVPFITVGLQNASENKEFTFGGNRKYFEATPASFVGAFKGVYAPQEAKDLYGIDDQGNLHKGGESATINAFHAYYKVEEGQSAPAKISFEGDAPTAINGIAANEAEANEAVYDLSGRRVAAKLAGANLAKGIYVVGGKKVAVK